MKSKRAKGLLESRRRFNEQGTEYHCDDVLDIIEIAEQDAEERAKYALKYALKFMTTLTESQKDAIAMHFEDALNNL